MNDFTKKEIDRGSKYKSWPDIFQFFRGKGLDDDKKRTLETGKGAIPLDIIQNPNKTSVPNPI